MNIKEKIDSEKTYLGIEFGSTRIKAILIDDTYSPVASGTHEWENRFENGYWTYSLGDIHKGLQECYSSLKKDVFDKYGAVLKSIGAIGISAMMHGYMAFDRDDNLLTPFRTWRNTTTYAASKELTKAFDFNIPQRWSIAHLYQAMLDNEPHVSNISHLTTLAGYIHFMLTGQRVAGVGEASGMFPVNKCGFDKTRVDIFERLALKKGFKINLRDILPKVQSAGEEGSFLTKEGALFLDPSGELLPGIPLCPPEGDAGTGMTATNSILPKTGNVSAGTSIFSMLVLQKPLENIYPEIDIVSTPDGAPAAMVHCNNCCSELDAWVNIFKEFTELSGHRTDKSELYDMLYRNALCGDSDCGGVMAYNYLSGEPVTGIDDARPMYFRSAEGKFNLANFFRAELVSAMAALKIGMDILFNKENVRAEKFTAHGGLFKVKGVAQKLLADGLNTPVAVMKTAGEGGAWGMSLLAAYMIKNNKRTLAQFLSEDVFSGMEISVISPEKDGVSGFNKFIENYKAGLEAQKGACAVK